MRVVPRGIERLHEEADRINAHPLREGRPYLLSKMICVILDTNFLFLPFQFRIDIFEELGALLGGYKPIVLSTTLRELRILSRSRSDKVRMQAASALEVAGRCEVVKVERFEGETFDDVVLRVAKKMGCAVATNDREMRRRLRHEGIPVVYLRGRSRLEVDGYIP